MSDCPECGVSLPTRLNNRTATTEAEALAAALERLPKDRRHYVVERYPDAPDGERWYCGIFGPPAFSYGHGPTLPDAIAAALAATGGEGA